MQISVQMVLSRLAVSLVAVGVCAVGAFAEPEDTNADVYTMSVDIVRAEEEKQRQKGQQDGCSLAAAVVGDRVPAELPASGTVDLTAKQLTERLEAAYKEGRLQACQNLANQPTGSSGGSGPVGTIFRPGGNTPRTLVLPGTVTRPSTGPGIGTIFEVGPDGLLRVRDLPATEQQEVRSLDQVLEEFRRANGLDQPGQRLLLNRDRLKLELDRLQNGLTTSAELERVLREVVQPVPQ